MRLLAIVDRDPVMKRQLREHLKIDEAKWVELEEALRTSVAVDNRTRLFRCSAPATASDLDVLFPCHQGQINFRAPLGIHAPASEANSAPMCAASQPCHSCTTACLPLLNPRSRAVPPCRCAVLARR